MRRGFTLIEIAIAVAVALVLLASVYAVTSEATDTAGVGTSVAVLESQASRALDRIATELTGAGLSTVEPEGVQGEPTVIFRKSRGAEGGEIEWGPRQSFELRDGGIVWIRDVDAESPRAVVLTGGVRALAEGESANGADDNGNGLVDEPGLSFELSGRTLTIRLTLERADRVGGVLTRTMTTSVKLRN
jgi:prepilin-type N-terminal cleavage/methylation domain-containing protein